MDISKLHKIISNSVFCYSRPGEQGYVSKETCACYQSGDKDCQSYKDHTEFYALYNAFESLGLNRQEIMTTLKDHFKDSIWFRDNVKM